MKFSLKKNFEIKNQMEQKLLEAGSLKPIGNFGLQLDIELNFESRILWTSRLWSFLMMLLKMRHPFAQIMYKLHVSPELVSNKKIVALLAPGIWWLPIGGHDMVIDPITYFPSHCSRCLEILGSSPATGISVSLQQFQLQILQPCKICQLWLPICPNLTLFLVLTLYCFVNTFSIADSWTSQVGPGSAGLKVKIKIRKIVHDFWVKILLLL